MWLGLVGLLVIAGPPSAAPGRGRVTSDDREPIRRVTVTLESRGAGARASASRSTTTDEEGRFRFAAVEPGTYRLTAEKDRWVRDESTIFVSEEDRNAELEADVVMRLTLVWQWLAKLQVGLLVYLVLFGLLVLAVNMWIVPEPSREITVVGWAFMAAGVAVGCIKQMWLEALFLAFLGAALGGAVHRFGGRAAARRVVQIDEERRRRAAESQQRKDKLAALVGKEGVTLTDLKACGSASVEGEIIEVRALDGFIAKGTKVVITMLQGKTPVVEIPGQADQGRR